MSGDGTPVGSASRRRFLRVAAGVTITAGVGRTRGAQTGQPTERWRFHTGGPVFSSPSIWDGTVYVGTQAGAVYALDSESGELEWRFGTDGAVNSSPLVASVALEQSDTAETEFRDLVFIGSEDQFLYALDAETGELHWEFETGGRVHASPGIEDETVFVTSDHDGVYAIDAATGEQEWFLENSSVMLASPTVLGGSVFVRAKNLLALDTENGWERWEYELGSGTYSSPTVANETVYIGDRETNGGQPGSSGNIHAIDARSGEQRWEHRTNEFIDSSPTLSPVTGRSPQQNVASGNTVFVGGWFNGLGTSGGDRDEYGSVFAIDARTGREYWAFETNERVLSSPTTAGGVVFVGSWDGGVYALDATTGEQRWRFETMGKVSSSPTAVDGTVFVGSNDGNLYALSTGVQTTSEDSRIRVRTLGHNETERNDVSLIPRGELDFRSRIALGVGAVGGLLSGGSLLYRSYNRQNDD